MIYLQSASSMIKIQTMNKVIYQAPAAVVIKLSGEAFVCGSAGVNTGKPGYNGMNPDEDQW